MREWWEWRNEVLKRADLIDWDLSSALVPHCNRRILFNACIGLAFPTDPSAQ